MDPTTSTSNRSMYLKATGVVIIVLIVVGIGVHYVDTLILGKAPVVELSPSQLSTAVSKSLGTTSSGATPQPGRNYSIRSIQYFSSNTWAVVFVAPIGNDANNAIVVMQKQNGKYVTVLGPGSDFSASSLPASLPASVLFYLNSQGMVNNGA